MCVLKDLGGMPYAAFAYYGKLMQALGFRAEGGPDILQMHLPEPLLVQSVCCVWILA